MFPDRIESERLVIRSWEPDDAPLLHAAITASVDHLRPWMPWIAFEPQTVEERRDLIEQWRNDAADGKDHVCGVFLAETAEAVGGTASH